jgi:hypothetical protein
MNYKVIEVETEGDVGVLRLSQPGKCTVGSAYHGVDDAGRTVAGRKGLPGETTASI